MINESNLVSSYSYSLLLFNGYFTGIILQLSGLDLAFIEINGKSLTEFNGLWLASLCNELLLMSGFASLIMPWH